MSIRYILILDILETMDVVKVPRIPCSFCEGTFLVKKHACERMGNHPVSLF